MPNRIIKESICTSENIDQLSPFAEITFYRLIVNCDDYGRMDARPKIVKSRLFPLKETYDYEIEKALKELENADLVIHYYVDGKPYLQMKTWDKHQQVRAKRSKYPSQEDVNRNKTESSANKCKQMQADVSKCPRNPIQSLSLSESESMMDDDNAHQIQSEQNRVLDAAKDAGFKLTNNEMSSLIALYADFGLDKILDGIKSCSEHGVANLAYLRAVLKGEPKKAKPKVNAQDYSQRDYDTVTDELMQDQIRDMEAFMQREGKT